MGLRVLVGLDSVIGLVYIDPSQMVRVERPVNQSGWPAVLVFKHSAHGWKGEKGVRTLNGMAERWAPQHAL